MQVQDSTTSFNTQAILLEQQQQHLQLNLKPKKSAKCGI